MGPQLGPIAQVKLWNHYINEGLEIVMTDLIFKLKIKLEFLLGYRDTLEEQGINGKRFIKIKNYKLLPP